MDYLENLNPASAVSDENLQKLSHEDFQKLLSGWFDRSGLITETRSYLRMQLIRMLSATKLGLQTSRPTDVPSTEIQIINILIAEHLVRYKYLYTLSMFSNEISALSIPPEFNFLFVSDHGDGNMQFERNQIMKILNYLNVSLQMEDIEHLFSEYYLSHDGNKNRHSLLFCLLKNIPSPGQQMPIVEDIGAISVMRHLRHLLNEINAPQNIINAIERTLQQFLSEIERKYQNDAEEVLQVAKDTNRTEKRDAGTQKSDDEYRSTAQEEMRLISLHNEKSKMIKRIYKYRVAQMEKVHKQLEERLKKFHQLTPFEGEECKLKHCGTICRETLRNLNQLKQENRRLSKFIKARDADVKKIESKLEHFICDLKMAQKKVIIADSSRRSKEDDIPTDSEDKKPTDGTFASDRVEKQNSEPLFQDVFKRLEGLENENEQIDNEYKLFKKLSLP